MQKLPEQVQQYKQTPSFNQDTVPSGFLNEHFTKPGTWGVLKVESGCLEYNITEPGFEEQHIVGVNTVAIIAPEHRHYVKPMGEVTFHVEFYR